MKSRLFNISPELYEEISEATPIIQLEISSALANWALDQVSFTVTAPCTEQKANEILAKLDAEYFKLESLKEAGKATEQEVVEAFSKARAIHSLVFSLNKEPIEAAYEAIIATGNILGAQIIVRNIKA